MHGRHDRAKVPPNKLGIEIEAALAFGTGHHGTTRGCLLLLEQVLKARHPRRVLDLGTGTGVLAIAAAKALHRAVLASDIDAASVQVARDNAHLNDAGNLVQTIRASGFSAPQSSRAIGVAHSVGAIATSGRWRDRRLPRARAGIAAAYQDRRLEQLVDA